MDINKKRVAVVLTLFMFVRSVAAEHDAGPDSMDWQHELLFHPSEQYKLREQTGFVMIYDGMTDKAIERALDEQFDRMSSMMFIRTVVTDPAGVPLIREKTGEAVTEDDDC